MEVPSGDALKSWRKNLGLTQNELAELAGLTQSVVAKVEAEKVDARASTLRKMVEALKRIEFPDQPHSVADIMVLDLITLRGEDTIQTAIDRMVEAGVSQLPVLSQSGSPIGLVSEASLLAKGAQRTGQVKAIMATDLAIVAPSLSFVEARRRLDQEEALLICEEGELVGIVSRIDMIRALRNLS